MSNQQSLIFLDHIWYRLGYVRNSRLYGGFTRTYGHLGSPILEPPLNAYSGNDGNPGIESTNIMLYNDLCWYDANDYLDKNPAEVKTPLFFQIFFENKWTVDRPWTPRGTHILARGKDILARGTDIPARGHCDQQKCAIFRIYSAQSPDQTFSTAPKNWTKMEDGRCGLLVALCWRY